MSGRHQLIGKFLGTHLQVLKVLGEGTFAVVLACHNLYLKKVEAVKIFKQHHDADVAQREVSILQRMRCLNPDKANIIRWHSSFSSEQLTWISFELLDRDLRSYMKNTRQITASLPVAEVKPILRQLLTAFYYLKVVGIVHADLKPENILCVNCSQRPIRVKLADFGLAQFSNNIDLSQPVQSLCYRAPEVLVGSVFDEAIDMWSLGAVAAELVLGSFLYGVCNEYDALRAIIETQGQPPDEVLDRGIYSLHYFQKREKSLHRWKIKTPEVFERQTGSRPEKELNVLGSLDSILDVMEEAHGLQQDQYELIDLITEMLNLDPKDRIDPEAALNDLFFSGSLSRDSQQGKVQAHRTAHVQPDSQRDVQVENNRVPTENCGPVQPDAAYCQQVVSCEYAQQMFPSNGQHRPWVPGYYQGHLQYLTCVPPIRFAHVYPGIPAHNQMANCMYHPGCYNVRNWGCNQLRVCTKPLEEAAEGVSVKKKAKKLYVRVLQ